MSAYTKFDTCISDQDALVASLKEMGYEPKVHKEAQQLTGYMGDKRAERAHVIIPRSQVGSASNDIGFYRNEKGTFQAIVSEYDQGLHGRTWQNKVKQTYAEKKTMTEAKKKGYVFLGKKVLVDPKTQQASIQMQFRPSK